MQYELTALQGAMYDYKSLKTNIFKLSTSLKWSKFKQNKIEITNSCTLIEERLRNRTFKN